MFRCTLLGLAIGFLGCGAGVYQDETGDTVCFEDGEQIPCELLDRQTAEMGLAQNEASDPLLSGGYTSCRSCDVGCTTTREGDSENGSFETACCYGSIRTVSACVWTKCKRICSRSSYDCATGRTEYSSSDTITCDDPPDEPPTPEYQPVDPYR